MAFSARALLLSTAGAILALCGRQVSAQATSPAENPQRAVAVPFIGCESFGQIERLDPPKGTSRMLAIKPKDAELLAYYESADRIGLLAPRGWHCEGASGSGGAVLFLSPTTIERTPYGWKGLDGSAIEVNYMNGGSSGMYGIAEIIARVFPTYMALAKPVLTGMDIPIPSGPFPKDKLIYRSKKLVEYLTPARTEGLGTYQSWLKKSDLPIAGVVILIGDPPKTIANPDAPIKVPDLLLLQMRFHPDLPQLTPVIVGYLERQTMGTRK